MKNITTSDIIDELNLAKSFNDFLSIAEKYENRVTLSFSVNIDGSTRPLDMNILINKSTTGVYVDFDA